ncbi:unnamed protein product [Owenia fusiformis]|uniref:Uncharacterized protein n=1 Tax=Owenia fusiformis TaxID=6347 RepID=A0A8J1YB24_OWEFU|nr:unnamed protein product [Owenia fusiformis]
MNGIDNLDLNLLHRQDRTSKHKNNYDLSEFTFPFENFVFEGGGNKGLAYSGCIRVLEEIGVWGQSKRLCGTSSGAMTATLLAVGYNSYEVERFQNLDLHEMFLDTTCGLCSLLPNVLKHFGWNPGNRILKWLGDVIAEKTGNKDITFKQLYDRFDKELCVVVTNLNHMSTEYCHVKTTPNMPVRIAVRMSMSIPGLFKPVKWVPKGSRNPDYFIDGGLLSNYAIHAFDGWWLSMAPSDSFLKRLHPLEKLGNLFDKTERFGSRNDKTLGFLLYADKDVEVIRPDLDDRADVDPQDRIPNTKLARQRMEDKRAEAIEAEKHSAMYDAVDAFLDTLADEDINLDSMTNKEELKSVLEKVTEKKKEHYKTMFGNSSIDDIFNILDKDNSGQISFTELVNYFNTKGVDIQQRFTGVKRQNISGLKDYINIIQQSLSVNLTRIHIKTSDAARTVGINTGYIGTTDFDMEDEDKDFLVEQGRRSTISFLRQYIDTNNLESSRKLLGNSTTTLEKDNDDITTELTFIENHIHSTYDQIKDENERTNMKLPLVV